MDEDLKKEFEAIRAELKGSALLAARIDQIERSAIERNTEAKKVGEQLDAVRTDYEAMKKEFAANLRERRLELARGEGVEAREHGLRIMAAQARAIICRAGGIDLPKQFHRDQELMVEFQRATLEAGAVTGSYLVPTVTAAEIVDTLEQVSELVGQTDFRADLPGNVDLPTLVTRPTLQHARATVDTAMTASDPAFGQVQIRPDEGYIYFGVDNRLLQMSSLSLGTLMTELVRDGIVEGLANDLLNADGSAGYNSITGILNEATAAYIYTLPGGKTAFADITKKDLTGIMAKALKRGRANGSWLLSLDTLGYIEDLDRQGKTPVVTYDAQGNPRIMMRPVIIDEGMPDAADSAISTAFIGFGDLRTYVIGLVQGIQLASSTHDRFAKNQTTFRGTINYDIKRKPVATFVVGKTPAA